MKKAILLAAGVLCLAGLVSAELVIPPDQPICRLYGMMQVLGTICGTVALSYAGVMLLITHDLTERNNAKLLIGGVVMGLLIIWLAPHVVKYLVDAADICGW